MNEIATQQELKLTKREVHRFEKLEKVIEAGLKTFYEVGAALAEIREARLYRKDYPTFEAYCRTRWGMSKTSANRHILAAQAVDRLAPIGVQHAKESQIRPLTKLPPEKQVTAWETAVKTAGSPEKVTASVVMDVVDQMVAEGRGTVVAPRPVSRYVNHTRMMRDFKSEIRDKGWSVDDAALRWLSRYK